MEVWNVKDTDSKCSVHENDKDVRVSIRSFC